MKITLNPSRPDRAKLHMEAAWHFIYHRKRTEDVEVYTFKHFGVGVYRAAEDIETRETENAWRYYRSRTHSTLRGRKRIDRGWPIPQSQKLMPLWRATDAPPGSVDRYQVHQGT